MLNFYSKPNIISAEILSVRPLKKRGVVASSRDGKNDGEAPPLETCWRSTLTLLGATTNVGTPKEVLFFMPVSNLHRQVKACIQKQIAACQIVENSRPEWLQTPDGQRLELDIYFPEFDLAIEIQGQQHFVYVPHFHKSEQEFYAQMERDSAKRILCDKNNVKLIEIDSADQIEDFLQAIKSHIQTRANYAETIQWHADRLAYIQRATTERRAQIEVLRKKLEVSIGYQQITRRRKKNRSTEQYQNLVRKNDKRRSRLLQLEEILEAESRYAALEFEQVAS